MPEEGVEQRSHANILRYEEMELIIRAAAEMGISKVRLTGGEPLARLGIADFVGMVSAIPCIDDLSMTTNGTLLARHARALAEAGLQRLNVSLDSLRPDRFTRITRLGRIQDVYAGIAAAQAVGLDPIKFNVVVIRGLNDDEVTDFARKTITDGWHVRFIELMPIGANLAWAADGVVTVGEMRHHIEQTLGPLQPVHGPRGNGPARYHHLIGAEGTIGFIGAKSDHFCAACNRLRLTADGKLRPCLMSDYEIDLGGPLRAGAGLDELKAILSQAIRSKPEGHHLDQSLSPHDRTMAQIGG
jgi:GTP 3',8-cyclase